MSYAPKQADQWRRAADFVDKILKGTKPADIPVEQPTKFEFLVNFKSAKQIGVTVSPNVLARADRVFKIILDFGFSILDYREKQMHKKFLIQFGFLLLRQSKSRPADQNQKAAPQTKMGWDLSLSLSRSRWCGVVVEAQQPAKIPRIGILFTPPASVFSPRVEALRQRLRELGYVEGKNIVIDSRSAEGKRERLPDLAAELVRLKVDVIVTVGSRHILAAKKASATIPIVFAGSGDPVGTGIVSQPGATRREYHRN